MTLQTECERDKWVIISRQVAVTTIFNNNVNDNDEMMMRRMTMTMTMIQCNDDDDDDNDETSDELPLLN